MLPYLRQSWVSMYLKCPKKFELAVIRKVKVPTSPGLFIGWMVHKGIEQFFRRKLNGLEPDELTLHRLFFDAWTTKLQTTDVNWDGRDPATEAEKAWEMVKAYTSSKHAQDLKPKYVEIEFIRQINGIKIAGRIDLITESNRIIDFKTAARKWSAHRREREIQPLFYIAGFGRLVPFEYHFIYKKPVPEIEVYSRRVTANDMNWFVSTFLPGVWVAMNRGVYPPCDTTDALCSPKWCEYWEVCPYGGLHHD